MPHQVIKTFYTYDELSDAAKSKARDWYREASAGDNFYAESALDDAKTIGKMIGIDIDDIYYSGFSSQGDGACFTGTYSYRKGGLKEAKAYAPGAVDMIAIAERLQDAQRRNFYKLEATIKHRGHYNHEYSMDIDVFPNDNQYNSLDADNDIEEALRDYARWIYRNLEEDYEYHNSDEAVAENIIANEYTFDEDGNRE